MDTLIISLSLITQLKKPVDSELIAPDKIDSQGSYIEYKGKKYIISIPNETNLDQDNSNINKNGWKTISEEIVDSFGVGFDWAQLLQIDLEGLGYDEYSYGNTNYNQVAKGQGVAMVISVLYNVLDAFENTIIKLVFQCNEVTGENRVLIMLFNENSWSSKRGVGSLSACYQTIDGLSNADDYIRRIFPDLCEDGYYDIRVRYAKEWSSNMDQYDKYLYIDGNKNIYLVNKMYPDDVFELVHYDQYFDTAIGQPDFTMSLKNLGVYPVKVSEDTVQVFIDMLNQFGYYIK